MLKTTGKFLSWLLFPKSLPNASNLRQGKDFIYWDSLPRGTLVSGNPGTSKSTWVAMMMLDWALDHPDCPIFCTDKSEALINTFVELYHYLPREQFEAIDRRVVIDRPGDEKWVIPKPLFSAEYSLTQEDMVQKAVDILKQLNQEIMERTPIMALAIKELFPEIARLLSVIKNEFGESWQLTDAKKLLMDTGQLRKACNQYGFAAPDAKWYFEHEYLELPDRERDLRSYALRSALGVISPNPLRARYGYPDPGITEKEVIEKGLVYLTSLSALNNQPEAEAFVSWDGFASLKAIINKRIPHDPANKPVLTIWDEAYQAFKIPGMAEEMGQVSNYYRSRLWEPVLVIQNHGQLNEFLRDQIWNLANHVIFAMDNQKDAYEIAQQRIKYEPAQTKSGDTFEHPVAEPDRGQFLQYAYWIQNLKWRQCLISRYVNERDKDPYIRFVKRTREKPKGTLPHPLIEIKEEIMRRRGIPVREALKVVNNTKLNPRPSGPPQIDE